MTRLFFALIVAIAGFLFGLRSNGWDLTPDQLGRFLDDPGAIPTAAWLLGLCGFLGAFMLPAFIAAARRSAPTVRPDTPTPTKATDAPSSSHPDHGKANHPDLALPKNLREESPALCIALSSVTLFVVRFFTVPQGWMFTITAFGKYRRLVPPGLGYCISLWGLFERVGMAVPQMEQIDTFDEETVFTSDGVNCLIDVMVCYRVVNPEAAVYQVSDYRQAIRQLVQAVLRNECGKRTTRNLLSGREEGLQGFVCGGRILGGAYMSPGLRESLARGSGYASRRDRGPSQLVRCHSGLESALGDCRGAVRLVPGGGGHRGGLPGRGRAFLSGVRSAVSTLVQRHPVLQVMATPTSTGLVVRKGRVCRVLRA